MWLSLIRSCLFNKCGWQGGQQNGNPVSSSASAAAAQRPIGTCCRHESLIITHWYDADVVADPFHLFHLFISSISFTLPPLLLFLPSSLLLTISPSTSCSSTSSFLLNPTFKLVSSLYDPLFNHLILFYSFNSWCVYYVCLLFYYFYWTNYCCTCNYLLL